MKRVFISDCEGPISKNDNAFELTAHFVPSGDRMFTILSRYDDVLAYVVKRAGYEAGDTLKLVLPFLKAYDVRDKQMQKFSRQSLILISNAQHTLQHVRSIAPAFIVSTSYEHYVKALCQSVKFPSENTYCTRVSLDNYRMTEKERKELRALADEISQMPKFEAPPSARSLKDLSEEARLTVGKMDEIFWKQIAFMQIGKIFSEVRVVGGAGKVNAIEDIVSKQGVTVKEVMYIGDSITDIKAFEHVKGGGGLTVSFNGNEHAVRNAEVAILSKDSIVTAILADVFLKCGKTDAMELVEDWSKRTLEGSQVDRTLLDRFSKVCPGMLPKVKIIKDQNREGLCRESSRFRKKVRGEAIGKLG